LGIRTQHPLVHSGVFLSNRRRETPSSNDKTRLGHSLKLKYLIPRVKSWPLIKLGLLTQMGRWADAV